MARGHPQGARDDGRRLLVSASTARIVQQIDTRTGRITGSFESGDQPHENNFSRNGRLIYHASIGRIYTPSDPSQWCPFADPTKGKQYFQIVDNATFMEAAKLLQSKALRGMRGAKDDGEALRKVLFRRFADGGALRVAGFGPEHHFRTGSR